MIGYDGEIDFGVTGVKQNEWRPVCDHMEKCWVCDRTIYSILLWSPGIGKIKQIDAKNKDQILRKIVPMAPSDPQIIRPIIYCNKNQWKGQEMLTQSEYCFIIDKQKPE